MNPVESSNVKAIGYDPKARELHVEYHNGGTWRYPGVSALGYAKLARAKSIGAHLAAHIKPKFQGEKV
jgi:lysyl-tRNA synthetase class 2